nr:hypothetical protein [Bradyrhizobium sp. BRP19]
MILIDNFDSFTFNIAQMVGEVNGREIIVLDNTVPWSEIRKIPHERIILSPGPGSPQNSKDVGSTMDVLAGSAVPVLGVCWDINALPIFMVHPLPAHQSRSMAGSAASEPPERAYSKGCRALSM